MKLYNSLTRTKEDFAPLNPPVVTMYACGLTPQNHPHLGHALAATRFSIIRRYLAYKGYEVKFAENVTDVDDKIIARSQELGITPNQVAERYFGEYKESLARLNLPIPTYSPKVTEYIPKIITYIEELIANEFAYVTSEGDVYFNVSKKKDYGKLSNRIPKDLKTGTRVALEENKRSPHDFALWKADTSPGATWPSPWGLGRPGWHIECSVMSNYLLGPTIDIHCGGLDLVFPHHENEIAQCEAHNGVDFVKYWVHCGLLEVEGKKMSKSLGNFITIDDALDRYGRELILFVVLRHHYRSAVDFNDKLFRDNLNSLCDYYWSIDSSSFTSDANNLHANSFADELVKEFETLMDDDLNTPGVLVLFSNYLNKAKEFIKKGKTEDAEAIQRQIIKLGRMLGLFGKDYNLSRLLDECLKFHQKSLETEPPLTLVEVTEAIAKRNEARKEKDFKKADAVRDFLDAHAIGIMDNEGNQSWRFESKKKLTATSS